MSLPKNPVEEEGATTGGGGTMRMNDNVPNNETAIRDYNDDLHSRFWEAFLPFTSKLESVERE